MDTTTDQQSQNKLARLSELLTTKGGKVFATSLATITSIPDTMLSVMFGGKFPLHPDENGEYFIDRNPRYFEAILDFLRKGKINLQDYTEGAMEDLLDEVRFYQIEPLLNQLEGRNEPEVVNSPLISGYWIKYDRMCGISGNTIYLAVPNGKYRIATWSTVLTSGRHRWAIQNQSINRGCWAMMGVVPANSVTTQNYTIYLSSSSIGGWGYNSHCLGRHNSGAGGTGPTTWQPGDSLTFDLDLDKGTLSCSLRNGTMLLEEFKDVKGPVQPAINFDESFMNASFSFIHLPNK